jgi:hypothetical protein
MRGMREKLRRASSCARPRVAGHPEPDFAAQARQRYQTHCFPTNQQRFEANRLFSRYRELPHPCVCEWRPLASGERRKREVRSRDLGEEGPWLNSPVWDRRGLAEEALEHVISMQEVSPGGEEQEQQLEHEVPSHPLVQLSAPPR